MRGGSGESCTAAAARGQGDILQEPRPQGDGVGIVFDPIEPQANIFSPREIDRASPRQTEHRRIGGVSRGLARFQGGAGEVVGGEDLAALDQRGDLVLVQEARTNQGTRPAPFSIFGSRMMFCLCESVMNRL